MPEWWEGAPPADAYPRGPVTALASYRRLLALAGPAFVVIAFLGRLPAAMSQMGALLLVATATGSYGVGGLAAGTLAVANAVGSPVAGGLADRVGQRTVVTVQSLVGGLLLLLLVALARGDAPAVLLVVASGAAGLFVPQVGPMARVRWRPITRAETGHRARLVEAAFGYEGSADEASFVAGPALIGAAVAVASPAAAVGLAAVLLLVFGTAFALHPTGRLRDDEHHGDGTARLLTAAFVVLFAAQLLVGVLFGSVQTGTSVLADGEGHLGAAGGLHALLGVGSVAAGLTVAALPARIGLPTRIQVFAAGMLLLSLPLLAADSLAQLAVALLILGTTIAPYMISNFTLAERVVPRSRVGAAMTLLAAATGTGYALGAAVAGRLGDELGYTAAFAVAVVGSAVAVALATLARPVLARAARDAAEPGGAGGARVVRPARERARPSA